MTRMEVAGSPSATPFSFPAHARVETRMREQVPSRMADVTMEAWCDGVQRLTQEYFSSLGELAVAQLGLRAPGRQGQCNGSSTAEKRAMMGKLRSDHHDDSELDVQATDIEATEMALLQQLWAHHQLQQKRQRTVKADDGAEKKDCSSGASQGRASTAGAVAGPAFTAPDGTSFTHPPSSSAAAPAAQDAAPDVACDTAGNAPLKTQQHPTSEPAARIPEELVGLFRTAQALRSAMSNRTRPPPRATPSNEAAEGDNPVDATADSLSRAPVVLSEEENAEAAALALLCFRYFYDPNSTTAPPVPPGASPASPTPRHGQPPRPSCMYEQLTGVTIGPQKRERHAAPLPRIALTSPERPPHACKSTDASSPTSLSSPAAWRKLIAKAGTLERAQQQQLLLQSDFSFGFPPHSASAEKASLGGKSGNNRGAAGHKKSVPLPLLNSHASPTPAGERLPSAAAPSPLPPSTTTAPAAAAASTPHVGEQHLILPALAPATTVARSSITTSTVPATATAASLQMHSNGANKAAGRGRSGHRRCASQLLPGSVVLPPNYSGAHGEKLTTAQLEQLVTSVSQDGAVAQADAKRQYDAADAAAAELYRLQQAVACVLLENIQLEKDISTLTVTSHACVAGDEDSDADEAGWDTNAPAGMRGWHRSDRVDSYGGCQSGTNKSGVRTRPVSYSSTSIFSPASTAHPFPGKRKRQLILPPAPMPLPHSKTALVPVSLLLGATGTKKAAPPISAAVAQPRPWREESARAESTKLSPKSSRQNKPRPAAPAIAAVAEGVTAAGGEQDPHTILQELRTAIASREAEKAQTLAEIDALSSRVTRHDTLLHAVAEYWRRNAAVMKRQHFAVQSQPKQSTSSENITRLGDGDDRCSSGNAVDATTPSYLCSASSGTHDAVTQTSSRAHSTPDHKHSHSIPITAATSPSGQMANLDESPSQLQRALAQMEPISPTPLSSSPSFDLHTTSSVAGARSPPLLMEMLAQRQIIPPRRRVQESESAVNKSSAMSAALSGATGAAVEAENMPVRVEMGVHITPATEDECGGRSHRKVVAPPREDPAVAGAAAAPSLILTDTSTTATTFLESPDIASDTMGWPLSGSAAVAVGTPPALQQKCCKTGYGHSVSAVTVNLFSGSPHVSPGNLLAPSPAFTHTHDGEAGEGDDSFPTTPLHPSRSTTAHNSRNYPISGTRREDEDVLDRGSWRIIPALQLENVDEIAEFIYSVFERP
ncbi:hypothetical protein, conserved [Leishmania lindenbergi]|uniref:Uncharacterized protein n=1 Tax=Leishmania lindenbergi TaxID=651832 RepID=A0AAW3AXR4_9TRYP